MTTTHIKFFREQDTVQICIIYYLREGPLMKWAFFRIIRGVGQKKLSNVENSPKCATVL